jgi:hypothetical protein
MRPGKRSCAAKPMRAISRAPSEFSRMIVSMDGVRRMGGKHEDDGGQDDGAVELDGRLRIASRGHLPALLQPR